MPGRREQRFETTLPVRLERGHGVARNVSASGIYFETELTLESGAPLKFCLEFRNSPGGPIQVSCVARVVRVEQHGKTSCVAASIASFEFLRVAQVLSLPEAGALRRRMNPKRVFDLAVTLLASPAWVPVLLVSSLAILLLEGRPVLYVSRRRVDRRTSRRVLKFRTMQRNAERIANRATVPMDGVRFLNIRPDSPLYTPIGSLLERCCFTELPQLLHVLAGDMSLVGNRPLPEEVIAALREAHPNVEDRFLTAAGLTGPVQLAGRERLTDEERLQLEMRYCRIARTSYSVSLDFLILLNTVLVVTRIRPPFAAAQIEQLMSRFEQRRAPAIRVRRKATLQLQAKPGERLEGAERSGAMAVERLGTRGEEQGQVSARSRSAGRAILGP